MDYIYMLSIFLLNKTILELGLQLIVCIHSLLLNRKHTFLQFAAQA